MPGALLDVIYPDLRGKTALVTGAGTVAGIGAAVCRALADQGCNIFFTYYSAANPADSLQVHEGECAWISRSVYPLVSQRRRAQRNNRECD